MKESALGSTRTLLVRLGYRLPSRFQYHLNATYDYLTLGAWMSARGHHPEHFSDREALFTELANRCGHEHVLYLEFGVAAGASIRTWSRLLRHPDTQLHGFDSFEGLPTDWILDRPAGHFHQGGEPPKIDDPRVHFHKGWFSDTLPRFPWPTGWKRLIANFDADLYSSTVQALEFVEDYVRPGTILYFDEFSHHEHERRAFDEFLERTAFTVRALAETRAMSKIAFEVTSIRES